MKSANIEVLRTILAAADTGDYKYGVINYDYYEPADEFHADGHPLALGAWKLYGNDARKLIRRVYDVNHDIFKKRYPNFLIDDLRLDWGTCQFRPSNYLVDTLKEIASGFLGIDFQKQMIDVQIRYCLASAESCGVTSIHGQMMWTNLQRLGGLDAPRRVFANCGVDANLSEIMVALDMEQFDKIGVRHVGNDIFGERHAFFEDCIEKYSYAESSNTKEDQ